MLYFLLKIAYYPRADNLSFFMYSWYQRVDKVSSSSSIAWEIDGIFPNWTHLILRTVLFSLKYTKYAGLIMSKPTNWPSCHATLSKPPFKRQPFTHSSQKQKSYKSISQDVMLLHFWTGQQLIIGAALQIVEKSFVSLTATIAMIYLPPPNNSPALCHRPKEPAS